MRLGPDVILPDTVQVPRYDRAAQAAGIVHFGIGAFHRAHQAAYTDAAMNAGDRNWGIIGVSMRSGDVAARINPQAGLYTVTEQSAAGARTRLIGAVQRILVAPHDVPAIAAAIGSPAVHIVSFTITEKGYTQTADGTFPAFCAVLADGLERRQAAGLGGVTLICCDNLTAGGALLERLMEQYLARCRPALAAWFTEHCACPSAMVDRIVPAPTLSDQLIAPGLEDHGAVVTEPFGQWVIEDCFAGNRPRWEAGGAQLVADVRPYETAKLRMLNGAHSALSYLGLKYGHMFVHQAIGDPAIRLLIDTLMRQEAAPTIDAAAGQNLDAYADALLARFANPALNHRLVQIAMDGSHKVPQRWLETLAIRQQRGLESPALLTAIAAWIDHLRTGGAALNDPRAAELTKAVSGPSAAAQLFGPGGLVRSEWVPSSSEIATINYALA
ncbi:mannitol dehydrogenase family protein [Novosphingobium sp.]|uniref:mannitol dehydrogenase family protein n=1 Tax=Novosphingobium sp. TaxID=1874826 RepID=UPI0025EE8FAA|nr:mannitol dehydrogenase family protein [Novosphingobium sp.]